MQRSSIKVRPQPDGHCFGRLISTNARVSWPAVEGTGARVLPRLHEMLFLPLMTAAESRDLVEDLQLLARHYAERLNLLRTLLEGGRSCRQWTNPGLLSMF